MLEKEFIHVFMYYNSFTIHEIGEDVVDQTSFDQCILGTKPTIVTFNAFNKVPSIRVLGPEATIQSILQTNSLNNRTEVLLMFIALEMKALKGLHVIK